MTALQIVSAKVGSFLGAHGKRAIKLAGGSSLSQLIPLALAPLLTRLYSAEDFGNAAIFASITGVLTGLAAGRYSVAVMLPKRHNDAVQVVGVALATTIATSLTLLLLVPALLHLLPRTNVVDALGSWMYLIPVAVLVGSCFETLSYFGLRRDAVSEIARAGVLKAATAGCVQTLLGFLGFGAPGLISGIIAGLVAGNTRLARIFLASTHGHRPRLSRMRFMARKYSNFPKFDLWGTLANLVSFNCIVIGIGAIYSTEMVGQYAIAFRFMFLPSAVIGVALGQVFFRAAALRVHSRASALRAFDRTALLLASVSILPMVTIAIFGPDLFQLVFGSEWRSSGSYAAAMTPFVWARFISSPLCSVYYIYGRQRLLLAFQILLLAIVLTTMAAASHLLWSLHELLIIQSAFMAAFYSIILLVARRVVTSSGPTETTVDHPYGDGK